jgi:hypothetical protein
VRLACVVEGYGEVEAVPVLLRRLGAGRRLVLQVDKPLRFPKQRLLRRQRELERAVRLAALRAGPRGAILNLLDADDERPAVEGPEVARRAQTVSSFPVGVVLAKREFEAWFLAAAESLSGCRGLPQTLAPPEDPEGIRGAKEWLDQRMKPHGYAATIDQAALAARFDIDLARRRSPSFDKFCRQIERLIRAGLGGLNRISGSSL